MSQSKSRNRMWRLCALASLVLLAGCGKQQATAPPRPPTVKVSRVEQQDVAIYGEWIGTLNGYVNAQIQPQVTGYVIRQDYREGSFVHKNDVLFDIDPRPFQAALDQARAQLAQYQAQLGNAELNVKRDVPEAREHAIPQSQLETDTQTELASKASVQAGQAAVEQAVLNLNYTKVRSLIDGIAGIAQVQVGNLVSPSTVLTAVSKTDPIKVYFPISAAEYMELATRGDLTHKKPLSSVPLEMVLADGHPYPFRGKILFADRQIDPQTGTIQMVGAFANPGNLLRPGQTARVRAITQLRKNALVVPQRAVTELQGQYEVAVVGADNKVKVVQVQVGEREGSLWVINQGLQLGERVVAEGTQKVRDGIAVNPVTYSTKED